MIKKQYVDVPDGQAHVITCGDEASVPYVLLHQTSDSATMWNSLLPTLASRGFYAVAPDIPGHGASYHPSQQPDSADFARRVSEIIVAMKVPQYHLMGHHFGATVALQLAHDFPDQVLSVALYGAPFIDSSWTEKFMKSGERHYDPQGEEIKRAWATRWDMSGRELREGKRSMWNEYLNTRAIISRLQAGPTWYWAHHAIAQTNHAALAKRVKCPALTFAGIRDHLFDESRDGVRHFPNGRFVEMLGAEISPGPDAADEYPEEFADILSAFVTQKVEK